MQAGGTDDTRASPRMLVRVYAAWLRPVLALAVALAAVNWVGAAVVLARAAAFQRVALPPPEFALEILLVSVMPFAAAMLVRSHARGEAAASSGTLTLTTTAREVVVPIAGVEDVRPWWCPLPGCGVALRMRSGLAFPWAVEADDPGALRHALMGEAAGVEADAAAAWADARHSRRPTWVEKLARWVVWPVVIAAVLFRADQLITYGDPLGAWQLRGPAAALRGFGAYLVASVAALAVIATIARAVGELGCAAWTAASPRRARQARAVAEWLYRFAVYVVPVVLLAIRFFG